jgi:hypothetical protein
MLRQEAAGLLDRIRSGSRIAADMMAGRDVRRSRRGKAPG